MLQIDVENEKRNLPDMYPEFVGDVGGWVSGYVSRQYVFILVIKNTKDFFQLNATDWIHVMVFLLAFILWGLCGTGCNINIHL